jgi:hypothetical protein
VNQPDHDRLAPVPPLLSVCAWCVRAGSVPPPPPGVPTTHGICPACAEGVLAEAEGLR